MPQTKDKILAMGDSVSKGYRVPVILNVPDNAIEPVPHQAKLRWGAHLVRYLVTNVFN